jgi:hypothetical protein
MLRTHNKSGHYNLSILDNNSSEIEEWDQAQSKKFQVVDGLILGSPCFLPATKDGRYTRNQRKVAYGYQISAFKKFGRAKLTSATATKLKDDITISHLCGTRNCCNPEHLVLESKAINDERTHCHFGLKHAKASKGQIGIQYWVQSSCCPHNPKCGELHQ